MKTVVYHSADFDGQFCREIAKKFLGEQDVQYIGWNFGDPPLAFDTGTLYVMDLPCDRPFGFNFADIGPLRRTFGDENGIRLRDVTARELIWIDHHKSSIDSHPTGIPGYRIDGVAACRLCWQWFEVNKRNDLEGPINDYLPNKQAFIDRKVTEPLAVRLAGEYDVWDRRDPSAETFQYGMRIVDSPIFMWDKLLATGQRGEEVIRGILQAGSMAQQYQWKMDALWLSESWHIVTWEGLKFLAQNSVQRGSGILRSKDVPETGHDALMLYGFRGKYWTVSMYHAKHRKDLDLSKIAARYGGGGHEGACGFTCAKPPFLQ